MNGDIRCTYGLDTITMKVRRVVFICGLKKIGTGWDMGVSGWHNNQYSEIHPRGYIYKELVFYNHIVWFWSELKHEEY